MSDPDLERIGNEILDLLEQEENAAAVAFFRREIYHAKQREIVAALCDFSPDSPRLLDVLASRQSGKSHGAGGAVCELGLASPGGPGGNILYVASTYGTCERMGYKPAKNIAETHELPVRCVDGDMEIHFPGGGSAYFMGADSEKLIARLRGTPNLLACIIDECGIYKSDTLRLMIETVTPGLRPRRGKLMLMGTPSLAGKIGTWFEATVNKRWLHLRMSYLDNDRVPSFADVERLIDEELEGLFPDERYPGMDEAQRRTARRLTAYFLREYGGPNGVEFVVDATEKVYELTDANLVDVLPEDEPAISLVGGDIGEAANDALLRFAWDDVPGAVVWLREERYARGQDSMQFADMVAEMDAEHSPQEFTIDPGGLGVKTINTARNLYPGINISEAEKGPIPLQVRALNQLLKGGRLKMLRSSQLAADLAVATKEYDRDHKKWEINEHGKHSDGAPSARYAAQKIIALIPDIQQAQPTRAETKAAEKAKRIAAAVRLERMRRDPAEAMIIGDGPDLDPFWSDDEMVK